MKHKFFKQSGITLARSATMGILMMLSSPLVHADANQARQLFKSMSEYLASQNNLSFDYDSNLEFVTKQKQKLALASSGAVTIARPNKIRATRTGGFADVELSFDGQTLSLLGKDQNVFGQLEIPGTLDQVVDQLRDKYNRPLPAADLLLSNVFAALMPQVTDVKDLGSGVIRGEECDHLAFRTKTVDWQIWIAQGQRPLPCRYVITSKQVLRAPQYTIDFRNWKEGDDVAPDDFSLSAPKNAKQLNINDLPNIDELPDIFAARGVR
jgi:hypothetical protein